MIEAFGLNSLRELIAAIFMLGGLGFLHWLRYWYAAFAGLLF